ncbi:YafY family transcriptional regulator [Algoriphagus lacus]|uniref:YafY family transcriptional regulator n=1 Tax=Algoriphagus lacus TaxID=2056311 RepID=A0A418PNX8_9BACT|nr:YafY family protein [Algoriphagus lacus]RIW13441.1 YafY family transcriptional regulator [Algoriphagus lacus]
MNENSKRLVRLTSILVQLQSKSLVTSTDLAKKFGVSNRTIYRDMKALEEAGVPLIVEEGKGYFLMEGYRIFPTMFTESEVNALITAEQLVLKNSDSSFAKEFSEAVSKIKSVFRQGLKEKAEWLSNHIAFIQNPNEGGSFNHLSNLQLAMTNFNCVELIYTNRNEELSQRTVEPFSIYNTKDNWVLVGFCQLRKEFRAFRLDRIKQLNVLSKRFEPHKLTLREYFEMCEN